MLSSLEAGRDGGVSFLACLTLFSTSLISIATGRSYSNGLIFYELTSHTPYLPPTVSVSRGRNLASVKYSEKGSIWSTFGQPCECHGAVCGCCAGLKVDQYKFDQKVCANVTFVPQVEEAQLEVYLNERPSSKYGISVRNPIPFCIPVMMGVPMAMCVQMTDVAIMNNQLNMCMDFVVRLATTDLFEMHFQCMRMGLDGLQYVDKNGKPVLTTNQKHDQDNDDDVEGDGDDDDNDDENDNDDVNDNDNDNDGDEETEPELEQQQQQLMLEEEQREPSPIESEMLMASDQLNVEEEKEMEEKEKEKEEMMMMMMEEEETLDFAGESNLRPNEVIETITMMHNYTADAEKMPADDEDGEQKKEEEEEEEMKSGEEAMQGEKEQEEETTTIAELANVSENEINIDDDDMKDKDKKEIQNKDEDEDEAKKEQIIGTGIGSETGTVLEEESESEITTEATQNLEEADDEEEKEDMDEANENEDDNEEGNNDTDADEGEDEDEDEGEEEDEDDNDNDKPKEMKKNQPTNSNESSSNSRQAVDDLANEVFTQSKRRRLRS